MQLEINIPESLDEIKLSQWQKFIEIENPNDYDVLKCFYGIDTKGVFKMKSKDVDRLVNVIAELLDEPPTDLNPFFELAGIEFGFIPKLDDMSYGENTDLSKYINEVKDANRAMAVMFRPIKKKQFGKYLIEDYEGSGQYSELMKSAPLSAYLSAKVFFCNLINDLLNYIPHYLREQSQHLTGENGETIQHYVDLLETTLHDLTKYQTKTSISA